MLVCTDFSFRPLILICTCRILFSGALTGDNKMQAEGKADKTKADAQHNANRF